MKAAGPVEPLDASAPLAWAEAPQRCYRNADTGDTCMWYHRVWQYLRLLGIISTVRTNTDFLTRTFRDLARTGQYRRALISATADYSMLAHLSDAYAREQQALDATVSDRCETSLFLNRWYAERFHLQLTTVCSDALEFRTDQRFDLICTHNFVGRFDTADRKGLIDRWHALLRPGGAVVTTQRIRPNSQPGVTSYAPDQARELSQRVVAAASVHPQVHVNLEELAEAVYEYAMRKSGHVIRTNDEITAAFTDAGFDVALSDEGEGSAEREGDRPSSTAGKDTYRMRIVARKR